jgi:type II secretory pathway pseudopilin PulG
MNLRGFSLVETIVVVSTTALISVTLGSLLTYFYKTNAYTLEQSTAVAQARRSIEDAMSHLREASYGSDGSYPLMVVATSSITFFAKVTATGPYIERVTYSLQKGILYRTVGEPFTNPISYSGISVATTTVATSVMNTAATPLFRYFDNTGTELASPADVSKVSSVLTTVVIDVNAARAPFSLTLSGSATLRNLKSQL